MDQLRQNTFIDYEKVRDSAHRQQPTTLVTVRDPIDNRIIAKIRNPKIGIKPYPDPELARIDIDKMIQNGEKNANISTEPTMRFSDQFTGWAAMISVVSDKSK